MFSISFMKNQAVTDEDINAVGYNLTNTAYTTFTNDTLYGVDELNAITAHMMHKGVKRNYKKECALTLGESIVHIDSGLAFFENGATITIDDDGIDLTLEDSAETQYVYLFFNDTINVGGARCTVEYPSGDFVLLGSITDGVLTQDRTFAFLNNEVVNLNEIKTAIIERNETEERDYDYYITDFNVTQYKKVFFKSYWDGDINRDQRFVFGVFDIQNQSTEMQTAIRKVNSRFVARGYPDINGLYNSSTNASAVLVEIIDGTLSIKVSRESVENVTDNPPFLHIELYGGVAE